MENRLTTPWGEKLDKNNVWLEYPRPQLVRESYYNLNGLWDYAITDSESRPDEYDGKILVPFSPEAALSGVSRQLKPGQYLHYRRYFILNDEFLEDRLFLNFQAVDQVCKVYLNGKLVGSHEGGYLPFSIDITEYAYIGDNILTVVVRDDTEKSWHARGKQKIDRGRLFYTAQSGIWQTVWMESVPYTYVNAMKITPILFDSAIDLKIFVEGEKQQKVNVEIDLGEDPIWSGEIDADKTYRIPIEDALLWTPETPNLYTIRCAVGDDMVSGYFAMRQFGTTVDIHGNKRFSLNGKPYFFLGVLDQGYWPDGLYTAPSFEALKYDIKVMKSLGFNSIRKHLKIECALWYFLCDTMGMIVWQDMVNGGGEYRMNFVCIMPNIFSQACRYTRDDRYKSMSREDEAGREQYYKDMSGTIKHLYNFPCIAAWSLFNEGWGQFDAAKASRMVKRLDSSRIVEEASGWFDQCGGDVYSVHNYIKAFRLKPQERVSALSECGGYSFVIKKHTFGSKTFGYKKCKSKEQLTWRYMNLMETDVERNLPNGLSAVFYTQLSDVEDETNGFMTYDRKIIKPVKESIRNANRRVLKHFHKQVDYPAAPDKPEQIFIENTANG